MITRGMMSSEHQDWETPQELFEKLDAEFHFDVDVCATPQNAKCAEFYSPDQDGLAQDWNSHRSYWMNPPYGRRIGKWLEKARLSAERGGATVVCLVPARTDTMWWQDNILNEHGEQRASEIRFLKGRVYFKRNGAADRAPFPSAVIVFKL